MCPASGPPQKWKVRPIRTIGDLARWLNLMPEELFWLADRRSQEQKVPPGRLRNYSTAGTANAMAVRDSLNLPSNYSNPFSVGCSEKFWSGSRLMTPRTDLDDSDGSQFCQPHIKREVVLKLDLKDFFPSILRAESSQFFLQRDTRSRLQNCWLACARTAHPEMSSRHAPMLRPHCSCVG